MRSSFLCIAPLICLALGCQNSEAPLDTAQAVSATPDEGKSLVFDFTKGDQNETATLLDRISLNEIQQLKGVKPQVLPIYLDEGDQILVSLWSDHEGQAVVYQPENIRSLWLQQEAKAVTATVKSGLDRAELNLTAITEGEYAIVLLPDASETEFILTVTCLGGPCQDRILQEEREAVREEREATSFPETPLP